MDTTVKNTTQPSYTNEEQEEEINALRIDIFILRPLYSPPRERKGEWEKDNIEIDKSLKNYRCYEENENMDVPTDYRSYARFYECSLLRV